ncbi:glycosyltransferase family 1 protein [Sporolactobacillus shoreae]|uniref:Glycosyltransferase family 1 protein n=1 Tax=Sporolactobacillus shoreae TaxID=1465501 RepID=A0A4Z0GT32_9BACL|nr:glycosyltransferase family 1 protein [Sporolactobacillus shoreae]TGA99834.1 glycosyltransferase family 1 protein [Sporolactobacillus shoreae]
MLNVNFGMQDVNHFSTGIGVFGNKIIMELMKYDDLDCTGHIFFTPGLRRKDFKRFRFSTKICYLPARWMYNVRLKLLPLSMRQICHRKNDVHVFFNYKLPRVKLDGKVVATIHDLIPLKTEMENEAIRNQYLARVQDAVKRSDEILTVSEYSRKDISDYFQIPENNIHIIPNGVDFAAFNTPIDSDRLKSVRENYQLPDKFILYFGSSRKHKNVESVIKAYARLTDTLKDSFHLVITNANEPLKQLAEKLGIQPYVRFVGKVDDSDKAAFYQLADLKLFLSLYEGFGIPILEAMAAGTPVITSNVSSLPEVSGDAALLVDPLDIDQIAEAVTRVLTDFELRQDMIDKGLANARKYTWENAAKILHDFLIHELDHQ